MHKIELHGVVKRFGQNTVCDGVDLTVEKGQMVCLIGASGAGKSTIFQLLLRFFDPTSGKIMLDGKPIISLEREEFRKHISIVTQDPVIFGTSALENIRFGRPEATDEEVVKAAKAAAAHDFLELLPDGYESFVGEQGVMLSGGQKQRLAIARAILRDAPVYCWMKQQVHWMLKVNLLFKRLLRH